MKDVAEDGMVGGVEVGAARSPKRLQDIIHLVLRQRR
jgi:hypothetical protein